MQYKYLDSIPYEERVLIKLLEKRAQDSGDSIFFTDIIEEEDVDISYREMKKQVDTLAYHLYNIGVRKGTHVGILMPTSRDYIFLWFALAKIGAIEVPFNTLYRGGTLEYLINDSDSTFLVVNEEFYDALQEISNNLKKIKTVIYHGTKKFEGKENWVSYQWEEFKNADQTLIDKMNAEINENPIRHFDPTSIIYTSGTTGPSKGVLITNHHLYFMGIFQADIMHYTSKDISLNFLPFYHVAAKFVTLGCMISGAKMILKRNFSVTTFWDEVRKYGVTLFPAVGGVMTMLYNQPPKEDDSDNPVRAVYAIPAPKENYHEIQKRFGVKLVEAYGSTEWNAVTATDMDEDCPGSCGKPLDRFVDVLIVDENDHPLGPGQAGELIVRPKIPHTVMLGYYNKPEKTVEAWRNLWFHTGDLFVQDEKGYLYFLDRIKDSIRKKGENISSFEMESMLNKHPKIAESAVIAVPSSIGEDDIKAIIVFKPGEKMEYKEIIEYCYENLGYIMVPRYIEIMDELPHTPTGKVMKSALREREKSGEPTNTWDCEKDGKIRVTSKGIIPLN